LKYYTIKQAAKELNLSERTVRKRISQGKIKTDGKMLISDDELSKTPAKGERFVPERKPDCRRYMECLNIYAPSDKIFSCDKCNRYEQEEI